MYDIVVVSVHHRDLTVMQFGLTDAVGEAVVSWSTLSTSGSSVLGLAEALSSVVVAHFIQRASSIAGADCKEVASVEPYPKNDGEF